MHPPAYMDTLRYLQEHELLQGYPPTLREIAIGIGYSPNSQSAVKRHIEKLAALGYVVYQPETARGIALTDKGRNWRPLIESS